MYGLSTKKEGQEDISEGRNEEEENDESEKEDDVEKDNQEGEKPIVEEQQQEQSVQDTQLPPPSPLHSATPPVESVTIKDVPDNSGQKINSLTVEDLKKILHQTTLQSQL